VQQIPPELSLCFPLPLPCLGIRPDIKQNCGSSLAQAAGYRANLRLAVLQGIDFMRI